MANPALGQGAPAFVPAGHPVDTGIPLAILSIVLPVLSTLAVGLRSYWRFWAKKGAWGWDDVLAILSLVAFIVTCGFSFASAQYGLGSFDITRMNYVQAMGSLVTFAFFYVVALALIKTSVAISVLRFAFQRRYRWPTLALAIITNLVYMFAAIWLGAFCGAFFRNKPTTTCVDLQTEIDIFVTVITMVTDAGCVFIPMFVVRNLRVSRRSKIGLMAALSVGMLPVAAAVIRIPFCRIWERPNTAFDIYFVVFAPLLSIVEVGVALIAASLPIIGGMFKWFSQPATVSTGNIDMATADLSPMSAADLERGAKWSKYTWRTKSTSTTRSILRNEESSSGRSNSVHQTPTVENGRVE